MKTAIPFALFALTTLTHAQDVIYSKVDGTITGRVTTIIQGDARVQFPDGQQLTIRGADIDSIAIDDGERYLREVLNRQGLRPHTFTFSVGGAINSGGFVLAGLDLRAGWKPTAQDNVGIGITFGRIETYEHYTCCDDDVAARWPYYYYGYCYDNFIFTRPPYEEHYCADYEYTSCAIYAHARHDFVPRTASPYAELRVGILPEANVHKVAFYGGVTIGLRIAMHHTSLLWGIGCSALGAHDPYNPSRHINSGHAAFNMNLAFEF